MSDCLYYNTTGSANTASGTYSLCANTTGSDNTANGEQALYSNTTGYDNTANGVLALGYNTTGYSNTANGLAALLNNTTGYSNTANGAAALYYNTTGLYNTANGDSALYSNSTGSFNIGLGNSAGRNLTTGSHNIAIGNAGTAADSGVIRIGTPGTHKAAYLAGISGVLSNGGVAVYVNAQGQLGTITSSRRFKNDIKDMGAVTDKLMRLRPVTFRYKDTAEKGRHSLQYGLIAEEVAKVYPDLVQYDKAGKPFTVYYHLLTPMLLNELQKEHRLNEAHKLEITELKSELASLKEAQEQQSKLVAKLAACVQTSQGKAPIQRVASRQH